MVYQNSTLPFEKMLMKFVADDDPLQEMLKCLRPVTNTVHISLMPFH